jgi:hypothetical protein
MQRIVVQQADITTLKVDAIVQNKTAAGDPVGLARFRNGISRLD